MSIKLILLVAAIPVVLVGSILLAIRILGWARKNRADAASSLIPLLSSNTGLLPDWLTERIDDWVSGSSHPSSGHDSHVDAHHPDVQDSHSHTDSHSHGDHH